MTNKIRKTQEYTKNLATQGMCPNLLLTHIYTICTPELGVVQITDNIHTLFC